jgi:hypothetical protein
MKENNTRIITPLGILLQQDKKINNDIYNDKPKKFERIIISYNFKKNNYYIDNEEIEGYEHKEFLLNTLHNFNNQAIFKFDSPYDPTCCERMIFLIPIIIVLLAVSAIYAIVLGVNMARAESAEQRDGAKKRIINFLIGAITIIVILILIYVLLVFTFLFSYLRR